LTSCQRVLESNHDRAEAGIVGDTGCAVQSLKQLVLATSQKGRRMTRLMLASALFLLFSCENPVKQEQCWFNAGFDSTYYMLFIPHGTVAVAPEVRAWNTVSSLKDRARNSPELERCRYALFAGIDVICGAFEEMDQTEHPGLHVLSENHIETEVGQWNLPGLTTRPEKFSRELYEATELYMNGAPVYGYETLKRKHEEELAFSKKFLNYLQENKEALRKAGWQVYLRERKFRN